VISLVDVHKTYRAAEREVHALNGVDLEFPAREFAAVMGRSGCGKSTLLHLIGGLDQPTQGEIVVAGFRLSQLREKEITALRRRTVGIVFQFFNLLPTLNVRENVMMPLVLQQGFSRSIQNRADELLAAVGLSERAGHMLHQLSGGEQQRAAIARALMIQPEVLLADEPTGNLDSESSEQVVALLRTLPERFGTTVLLATHSREIGQRADRLFRMKDGRLTND
jgi:putative ABC transport system ATP-binding protein